MTTENTTDRTEGLTFFEALERCKQQPDLGMVIKGRHESAFCVRDGRIVRTRTWEKVQKLRDDEIPPGETRTTVHTAVCVLAMNVASRLPSAVVALSMSLDVHALACNEWSIVPADWLSPRAQATVALLDNRGTVAPIATRFETGLAGVLGRPSRKPTGLN